MPAPATTRRTQAERREATKARLLDATIECLAADGYARTSVAAICARAGVSQGALFRHYPTRRDVIVAAADAIGLRHVAQFQSVATELPRDGYRSVALLIRELCRTPTNAAWREIMVAARTDPELREAARDGLRRFEELLIAASARFLSLSAAQAEQASVILLSVMHMFDSEAMTVFVYENEPLEQRRVDWVAQMLERELGARPVIHGAGAT